MLKLKSILFLLLRVSISILLLVILFKFNRIDIKVLMNEIKGADKFFLAAGFTVSAATYFLGFLRWKILLNAVGINTSLKRLISSFSGGLFFSIFLPSTIGGDFVRTIDLAGHTKKAKEVIATVFLDRLSGYIALVLVILPSLYLGRNLVLDKVVFSSVSMIIILLVFILLILFNNTIYNKIAKFLSAPGAGKIKEMIKGMHQEVHIFGHRRRAIIMSLLVSFFIQLVSPVSVYLIGSSLGIKLDFIYFLIFLPIIGAITLLPISIGGLGLREGLFVLYFAKVGVIKQLVLAMSLLSFSCVVFYGAIGGLIYVLTLHHRRIQPNQSSPV